MHGQVLTAWQPKTSKPNWVYPQLLRLLSLYRYDTDWVVENSKTCKLVSLCCMYMSYTEKDQTLESIQGCTSTHSPISDLVGFKLVKSGNAVHRRKKVWWQKLENTLVPFTIVTKKKRQSKATGDIRRMWRQLSVPSQPAPLNGVVNKCA